MAESYVLQAGKLGALIIDAQTGAANHDGVHYQRWVRQMAEWETRWEKGRQHERDAELGRLVRRLLALGGMVCRLDDDDGPVYVVEVYGEGAEGDVPVLVKADDPVAGLRQTLAQVTHEHAVFAGAS